MPISSCMFEPSLTTQAVNIAAMTVFELFQIAHVRHNNITEKELSCLREFYRVETTIVRSEMARPTAPKSIEGCQNCSDSTSMSLTDGAIHTYTMRLGH